MKIHHLIDSPSIAVTNEERKFINRFGDNASIGLMDDHNKWVAQNLVRRGIYELSTDGRSIMLRNPVNE